MARDAYETWLLGKVEHGAIAVDRAEAGCAAALDLVSRRPLAGRASRRWSVCREKPVLGQSKLLLDRFDDQTLSVLLLLDMRQNLDAVLLPSA